MHKDFNFFLVFSAATVLLFIFVFLRIVDPFSLVIISVTLVLAFLIYSYLTKREFLKLKNEIYYKIEEISGRPCAVGIKKLVLALFCQYRGVIKGCSEEGVDYKDSLAKLKLINSELDNIEQMRSILAFFSAEVNSCASIIDGNNNLKKQPHIISYLEKMFQCYRIANAIVSKMDKRRTRVLYNLVEKFEEYRNYINIGRVYGS